jgi:hypothetical protein
MAFRMIYPRLPPNELALSEQGDRVFLNPFLEDRTMKREVNTRRAKPLADLAGEKRLDEIERQTMAAARQRESARPKSRLDEMEDRARSGQREAMDDDDDE